MISIAKLGMIMSLVPGLYRQGGTTDTRNLSIYMQSANMCFEENFIWPQSSQQIDHKSDATFARPVLKLQRSQICRGEGTCDSRRSTNKLDMPGVTKKETFTSPCKKMLEDFQIRQCHRVSSIHPQNDES
ncbi:hypothetical protein VTN00DRAFT_4497 [Thermoascus crustaceus]|uniref:uncharacterized protein n=1 Tax=Thermoascus crustaceus TaxID=5088 RepID=UPI0037444B60